MPRTDRIAGGVAVVGLLGALVAYALPGDTNADLVLGQADFTTTTAGTSATTLDLPRDVAVDADGNVYVSDFDNHRVLAWTAASLSNGAPATLVIGQADFVSNMPNRGGAPSAITLNQPNGVAVDTAGNLYVADLNNNRVLQYDTPLAADAVADRVFGQPDFASNMANQGGGPTATSLFFPLGVSFGGGVLWVGDSNNHRVIGYADPLANAVADVVLGQANFTSNSAGTTANTLHSPADAVVDGSGNVYVSEINNIRVLVYAAPIVNGEGASRVLGQPDFTSNGADLNASGFNLPIGLSLDGAGNLYVADAATNNSRVLKFSPPFTNNEAADLVFGQADLTSGACNFGLPMGTASANRLCAPIGLFSDGTGNLWVAEFRNNRVLRFDAPVAAPTPTTTPGGPTPTPTDPLPTPTPTVPLKICNGLPATIVGTSGNDLLIGTDGDDVIHGKGGNDEIKGRGGADILCGGSGDDVVRGGGNADFLKGGSGNDFINGGGDRDVLVGNKGNDTLNGGDDDDTCIDGNGSNSFANCEDVDD